jgi:hypothetical protein
MKDPRDQPPDQTTYRDRVALLVLQHRVEVGEGQGLHDEAPAQQPAAVRGAQVQPGHLRGYRTGGWVRRCVCVCVCVWVWVGGGLLKGASNPPPHSFVQARAGLGAALPPPVPPPDPAWTHTP